MKNCEHCDVIDGTPHDRSCPEGMLLKVTERVVDAVVSVRGDLDLKHERQLGLVEALLRQFRDEEIECVHVRIDDPVDDPVDNPQHYGGRDNVYEVIKVMLAWHGPEAVCWFCQLNAEKYLSRTGKKTSEPVEAIEDLRKAAWYATAAADLLEHGKVRP